MALLTGFHRFALASDLVADGNGQSSNADGYFCTSDAGNLLLKLDTDATTYVTQFHLSLGSVSDTVGAHLQTVDSNSSDAGNAAAVTMVYNLATGAALSGADHLEIDYNPPIKVIPSATAVYLTPFLDINDSDALVSASYSGFLGNL